VRIAIVGAGPAGCHLAYRLGARISIGVSSAAA